MEQQFKVGQTVRLAYKNDVKLFILEVDLQTCYADVQQVWYTGRTFGFEMVSLQLTKFSQIELEAIPEAPEELKLLLDQYAQAKRKKMTLSAVGSYEEAANARATEKELKSKVLLYCDANKMNSMEWL